LLAASQNIDKLRCLMPILVCCWDGSVAQVEQKKRWGLVNFREKNSEKRVRSDES